jgi:Subtilase family
MAKLPQYPLLRLDAPKPGERQKRKAGGFAASRQFTPAEQANRTPGQRLQRLAETFAEGRDPLELRADAAGLAPERLLVFELTNDVQNFARAAALVPGLEFVDAEEFDGDDVDKTPTLYLMIPDSAALLQMVGLWTRFQASQALPEGFAPWRNLFAQLRDLRPWGPLDRVSSEDAEILALEQADARGFIRIELELVFRAQGEGIEADAIAILEQSGGQLVSRTRIVGAKYHALLADIPPAELVRVLERGHEGLVAAESVMHIRPQSAVHISVFESEAAPAEAAPPPPPPPPMGEPIVAIFDAVPVAAHPRLAGRLSIDDPFDLEPLAVGRRVHGTGMASAVVHGDIAGAPSIPLERRVFFLNVMFAPQDLDQAERFPERLPADLFEEAVLRMKTGADPTAPSVIVINASLGDRNKPFTGRMSGWARVVDYLAHTYGLLFIVSAGNHVDDLVTTDMTTVAFEALDPAERARSALRASAAAMAHRRILAPAESMNALTVGALHSDSFAPGALPASTFDVWQNTGLCTISSGLGPGLKNAVKPDVLAAGGRHHVRLLPAGAGHRLRPITQNSPILGGIVVAAPPAGADPNPDRTNRTVGTSVAAATLTGLAARAHELLEVTYDDFLALPAARRAVLLKALLVHCARWTAARDLIVEILGPADGKLHIQQKDNVRRYLGYGAVDAATVLECATDRATLWAVGRLVKEQSHTFTVPLPVLMSGKAQPHEISTTVAWFSPPRVGFANYRGIRLKLVEPSAGLETFAVKAAGEQPDTNQAHRGTVIHRRWSGAKAAALGATSGFEFMIQRQPDEIDDPIAYAVVTTVTMPGVAGVYAQVRDRVAVKPKAPIAVPA